MFRIKKKIHTTAVANICNGREVTEVVLHKGWRENEYPG